MLRHQIYQELGRRKAEFIALVEKHAGKAGIPNEWKGTIGLTGSNSARPSYLRDDIIRSITEGARSTRNLIDYVEEIRVVVKEECGEEFDAVPITTCEAALWASLDVLASPPLAGRGEMAASGGYGNPLERDVAAVAQDVRQEKMSVAHALDAYGVVVSGETFHVDVEATERERARRTTGKAAAAQGD